MSLLLLGAGGGSSFSGNQLNGAEITNFNEAAGRHVRSSSGGLDFRPGKTLYISAEFKQAAGANNEMVVGYYSGAYLAGKGWVIERGGSSNILYLTLWNGGGYIQLHGNIRLGVRQIAITWRASDNHLLVSVDGATAVDVGALSAPNSDGSCVVGLGSPVSTGNLYADSFATGSVACVGMIATELSGAQLAAASNSMNGATPLNRFTLPSQFTSPVVDFNAYRDWDGITSSFVTQGSSPITFAVSGLITKVDTSEVYYATVDNMYQDSELSISETYAIRRNAFARIRFTTSNRRIAIHQVSTIQGSYTGSFASIGIINSNSYAGISTSTTANTSQVVDSTLPAGSNKTIDLVEGPQAYIGGNVLGTFMSGIRLPVDAVISAKSPVADRAVIIGDSITNSFLATNAHSDGIIPLMRKRYPNAAITLLGWGSATCYEFTQSANRATWVTRVAAMLNGSSTNRLVIEVMTNDYGLNAQSAANYATNLGAFLDDLKVVIPGLQVTIITAIDRISPASEAANGSGNTLTNYRTSASGLTSGRAWVTIISGVGAVSPAKYNADGIHPATTGHIDLSCHMARAAGIYKLQYVADLPRLRHFIDFVSGVTLNGSNISAISDPSNNSAGLVQATAANQPLYDATGIASKPAGNFDGSNDTLGNAGFSMSGAQTFFTVFQLKSLPSTSSFFLLGLSGGNPGFVALAANYAGYKTITFQAAGSSVQLASGINPTLNTSPHSLVVSYNGGGNTTPGNYTCKYDGASQSPAASDNVNVPSYGSNISMGGIYGGLTFIANAKFACQGFFDRQLDGSTLYDDGNGGTITEVAFLDAYLAAKIV